MRLLALILLAGTCLWSGEAAKIVFEASFDGSQPLLALPSGNPNATGVLPAGVKEDSGWADVVVTYTPMQDPLGAGGWLRANITNCTRGRAQLKVALPAMSESAYYRVILQAASQEQNRVTVMFMDHGPPYAKHAGRDFTLASTIGDYRLDAQLGPVEQPVSLIVGLGTSGSIDIRRLRVERRTRAAVEAEIRNRHPDGGPKNLLATTHFPLGLPPGWSLGCRWLAGTDLDVRAQSEAPSPQGTVPLRLINADPGRPAVRLWSAPFAVAMAHQEHHLQFVLRGTWSGSVSVQCDGAELARREVAMSPGPAGAVVALAFQPALMGAWHQILFEGRGNAGLDQLLVGPGAEATPWTRQQRSEVAVQGRPETNQVFTADTPVTFAYHPSGDLDGCQVSLRAVDIDGNQVWRQEVAPQPGVVTALDAGRHLAGTFRLEARVLAADGSAVSPVSELVYHVVPPPRAGTATRPASPFGIHMSPFQPHLRGAKLLGANWARLHGPSGDLTYWSKMEPNPGDFRFQDARIAAYRDAGYSIVGMLAQCPGWARIARPKGRAWLDYWWQPADLDAWSRYVGTAVSHYAGRIDHWQIWNEPWGGFWFRTWDDAKAGNDRWAPGPDPLGDYLRLSQRAIAAIRTANPAARIIGVNGTRFDHGADWLERTLAKGGAEGIDIIAFHSYHSDYFGPLADPDSNWNRHTSERIYEPITRHLPPGFLAGPDGVWMTEGNATADTNDLGLYLHTRLGSSSSASLLRENARRLPLYHLKLLAGGTDKVFLYALDCVNGDWAPPAGKDWSVLVTPTGEFNVSASAYAALTWHLEGLRFAERRRLANGAEVFCFTGEGRAVAAVLAGPAAWKLPVDPAVTWRNLFANPATGSLAAEDLAYATAADLAALRRVLGD